MLALIFVFYFLVYSGPLYSTIKDRSIRLGKEEGRARKKIKKGNLRFRREGVMDGISVEAFEQRAAWRSRWGRLTPSACSFRTSASRKLVCIRPMKRPQSDQGSLSWTVYWSVGSTPCTTRNGPSARASPSGWPIARRGCKSMQE